MDANPMSLDFPHHVVTRYCALAYSGHEPQSVENVIICLLQLGLDRWKLLVDPAWLGIVGREEQDYIRELLDDMRFRVLSDSEALLKQLSQLSVGPLWTFAVGYDLDANSQLLRRLSSFVEA